MWQTYDHSRLRHAQHKLTIIQKPDPSLAEAQPAATTKAEKRAQHREAQKQLWDSADNPSRNHWLETQGVVPLKQELKPQVKLLSRKPAPTIAKQDDEDSEEEARKKREADFEERQRKAKLDREEKQRKYAEARERIMGSPKPGSPAMRSRESSQGRETRKPRTKVNGNAGSQPVSSADHSPARAASSEQQLLFDPNDMGRRLPMREAPASPKPGEPTRQPRGPDNNGRGGFGFAGRGGTPA